MYIDNIVNNKFVSAKPTFKNFANPAEIVIIETLSGLPVMLTCLAEGVPQPTMNWFKNSTKLTDTENIKIMNSGKLLTVLKSDKDTNGIYYCLANNSAGEKKKIFNVTVMGKCTHYALCFIVGMFFFVYPRSVYLYDKEDLIIWTHFSVANKL